MPLSFSLLPLPFPVFASPIFSFTVLSLLIYTALLCVLLIPLPSSSFSIFLSSIFLLLFVSIYYLFFPRLHVLYFVICPFLSILSFYSHFFSLRFTPFVALLFSFSCLHRPSSFPLFPLHFTLLPLSYFLLAPFPLSFSPFILSLSCLPDGFTSRLALRIPQSFHILPTL